MDSVNSIAGHRTRKPIRPYRARSVAFTLVVLLRGLMFHLP